MTCCAYLIAMVGKGIVGKEKAKYGGYPGTARCPSPPYCAGRPQVRWAAPARARAARTCAPAARAQRVCPRRILRGPDERPGGAHAVRRAFRNRKALGAA